jgi:hypothetical protein
MVSGIEHISEILRSHLRCRAARLAILYTIIRIQNSLPIRRALHAVGLGFIVLFIINNILLIVQCEVREKINAWHHIVPALCHVPDDIPVFQIVCEYDYSPSSVPSTSHSGDHSFLYLGWCHRYCPNFHPTSPRVAQAPSKTPHRHLFCFRSHHNSVDSSIYMAYGGQSLGLYDSGSCRGTLNPSSILCGGNLNFGHE